MVLLNCFSVSRQCSFIDKTINGFDNIIGPPVHITVASKIVS